LQLGCKRHSGRACGLSGRGLGSFAAKRWRSHRRPLGGKSANATLRASMRPHESPSRPRKSTSRPRRIPSRPRRIPSRPRRILSRPRRIPSSPRRIPSRPHRILSSPRRIPSRPRRIPSRPRRIRLNFIFLLSQDVRVMSSWSSDRHKTSARRNHGPLAAARQAWDGVESARRCETST
jgi:hypothetical protein